MLGDLADRLTELRYQSFPASANKEFPHPKFLKSSRLTISRPKLRSNNSNLAKVGYVSSMVIRIMVSPTSISSRTSIPSTSWPNTVCLPSR